MIRTYTKAIEQVLVKCVSCGKACSSKAYVGRYGYSYAEDSTSVLIIKVKDKKKSTIKHWCDFAIIDEFEDEDGYWHQFYIKQNKKFSDLRIILYQKGFNFDEANYGARKAINEKNS